MLLLGMEKLEFDIPTHKHSFPLWMTHEPSNELHRGTWTWADRQQQQHECNMQRKVHIFFKFQISPSKKIHFSGSLFSCTYFKICFLFCFYSVSLSHTSMHWTSCSPSSLPWHESKKRANYWSSRRTLFILHLSRGEWTFIIIVESSNWLFF